MDIKGFRFLSAYPKQQALICSAFSISGTIQYSVCDPAILPVIGYQNYGQNSEAEKAYHQEPGDFLYIVFLHAILFSCPKFY